MTRTFTLLSGVVALAAVATLAVAQARDPIQGAITARKSHMQLYAANLGVLGAMAQGNADYDAETAQAAADNLAALSMLNQRFYWPAGSAVGEAENTRALPAIWESPEGAMAAGGKMAEAAAAMQLAAGVDLASLQAAMGAVGAACGGCHETYRQAQ
jgi:cytochrome c556